jgi:hypothetical protein
MKDDQLSHNTLTVYEEGYTLFLAHHQPDKNPIIHDGMDNCGNRMQQLLLKKEVGIKPKTSSFTKAKCFINKQVIPKIIINHIMM